MKSDLMRYVIFFCIPFLLFCVSPTINKERIVVAPVNGMRFVAASGQLFTQGWDNASATIDEKPAMPVSFTYDYWIDTTEVTQRDYREKTGRSPVTITSGYGFGDSYPVYNVSWFDAVLYCNQRSKAEQLDTVYLYFGLKANLGGSVSELTGLRADLSKDGYRLPTESEWEFAARGVSSYLPYTSGADSAFADAMAWYSGNSENKTHPVAQKMANSVILYDMAGNVFEWTNDWKRPYISSAIRNSLGGQTPGNESEKVIKGGAFKYGINSLRPSIRSATYAANCASSCEYVGFRCARGVVPHGSYIGATSTTWIPNPVDMNYSTGDLIGFLSAREAKIALVNVSGLRRTLFVVDYTRSPSILREFTDDTCVFTPAISPDGHFAAWCNRNEGLTGTAKIHIRSIDSLFSPIVTLPAESAFVPRWWINAAGGDTSIVYTNSAAINASAGWKNSQTLRQGIQGGKPSGSPIVVTSQGGFHDGLSRDGRYALTSYTQLIVRDLFTNTETVLFMSPQNGKTSAGSSQVCNASLSHDTGELQRCMFLDFGSAEASTITGGPYDIHQTLFISTLPTQATDFIMCPPNEASWDYPEWANTPDHAIATVRNQAAYSHAVYVLDLKTSTYKLVVSGTELEQPALWVGALIHGVDGQSIDSVGMYNTPSGSEVRAQVAEKLLLFLKKRAVLDVVAIGSSQTNCGIDCNQFTGLTGLNMGIAGGGTSICKILLQDYIIPHAENLKVVIMSATPYWIADPTGEATGMWASSQLLAESRGFQYDKNHDFWKSGIPAGFDSIIKTIPKVYPCDSLGQTFQPSGGWSGYSPSGRLDWTTEDSIYKRNFAILKELTRQLADKKIHFVMVNFPENPENKNTPYYAALGPSWETGRAVMSEYKSLEADNRYFHFYDAYLDGNHDYGDTDAFNWYHLSSAGATKLTARLNTFIHAFLDTIP
jgi:uncharacterized protein (TIGR02171 family)